MRICYVFTQPPGYGGASTEAYETIKRLRALSHDVTGVAIDRCGECPKGKCPLDCVDLPYDSKSSWHDPDGIGGIRRVAYCKRDDPAHLEGTFDIILGKNYEAAWLIRKRTDMPRVFVTSGIDAVSRRGLGVDRLPEDGNDLRAFRSVDHVIVHSTLDLKMWHRLLPKDLAGKIHGDVVYTPDIAVMEMKDPLGSPYKERPFDLAFSASDWNRRAKNRPLAVFLMHKYPSARIASCGHHLGVSGMNVVDFGFCSHDDTLRLLQNSRVVVIPSLYDPSPNLYAEAVLSGANVVVSDSVGNIDGHPEHLLSESLEAEKFSVAVSRALLLQGQERYRTVDPMASTRDLESHLSSIVAARRNGKRHRPRRDGMMNLLRCPECSGEISESGGSVSCKSCRAVYPVRDGVVDFVGSDEYVGNFSREWDVHRHTQVDSMGYRCGYPGFSNSLDTFYRKTMLQPGELDGAVVLDGGCGSGRFAEVAGQRARLVVCVDMSTAVFNAKKLLDSQGIPNLCVKADLLRLPVSKGAVDVGYSIGVLHHTEDPERATRNVAACVRKGGVFAGWVYAKGKSYGNPLRDRVRAFTADPRNEEWVWKFSQLAPYLRDLRGPGWDMLQEVLGISGSLNDLECMLDTFDWLTPKYQYQYTNDEFLRVLASCGVENVQLGPFPVSFRGTVGR
jgi:SAM-dependent methyltransferase/glycosyltransferase involved in cell wall biosynthesis